MKNYFITNNNSYIKIVNSTIIQNQYHEIKCIDYNLYKIPDNITSNIICLYVLYKWIMCVSSILKI